MERIPDTRNVEKELNALLSSLSNLGITIDTDEISKLKHINEKLWEIEDKIRHFESRQLFNEEFIKLARSVYITNDERSAIKREINFKYSSEYIEEKSYVEGS